MQLHRRQHPKVPPALSHRRRGRGRGAGRGGIDASTFSLRQVAGAQKCECALRVVLVVRAERALVTGCPFYHPSDGA